MRTMTKTKTKATEFSKYYTASLIGASWKVSELTASRPDFKLKAI